MGRSNLFLALVLLKEGFQPECYFIPSSAWLTLDLLFCDRKYEENGLKSPDEWGLNISNKNMPLLKQYELNSRIELIKRVV